MKIVHLVPNVRKIGMHLDMDKKFTKSITNWDVRTFGDPFEQNSKLLLSETFYISDHLHLFLYLCIV